MKTFRVFGGHVQHLRAVIVFAGFLRFRATFCVLESSKFCCFIESNSRFRKIFKNFNFLAFQYKKRFRSFLTLKLTECIKKFSRVCQNEIKGGNLSTSFMFYQNCGQKYNPKGKLCTIFYLHLPFGSSFPGFMIGW